MSKLENSIVIKYLLQTIIKVIGRRTATSFAIVLVDNVIKKLKPKYDFLKYVELENAIYSEKADDLIVKSEINYVETGDLRKAIDEIFDTMIKSLGGNIGYYFIREINEDFEEDIGPILDKLGVNLDLKQHEYLQTGVTKTEEIEIHDMKNSKILELVLNALTDLLNKQSLESPPLQIIGEAIKKLENNDKDNFLNYVQIVEKPDSEGSYEINIAPEVDNILSAKGGETVQKFIEEIGKSSNFKIRQSLIKNFKIALGPQDLSKIEKIGVDLDNIDLKLQREGHEMLMTKIFEVIIDLIEPKTSKDFTVKLIDTIIEELQEKHAVLKYVNIDKSQYNDGINAISIMAEVNSVDLRDLGKAIKEMIKKTQEKTRSITHTFIDDFKNKIGEEYLSEMEKIGVNMHILELRFA